MTTIRQSLFNDTTVTTGLSTLATDLLVAVQYQTSSSASLMSITTPEEWVELEEYSASGSFTGAMRVSVKPALAGGETVTQSGGGFTKLAVFVLVDASIDGVAVTTSPTNASPVSPSVSPVGSSDLLIRAAASEYNVGGSLTSPSGYTSDVNSSDANGVVFAACHKTLSAAGDTGTATFSRTSSGIVGAQLVATIAFNGTQSITGNANLPLDARGSVLPPPVADPVVPGDIFTQPPGDGNLNRPPSPKYRLCVAETLTGKVLADLPVSSAPSWTQQINASGTLTNITVPLYPRLDDDVLSYLTDDMRYSIVFSYGDSILQAGLLFGVDVDDSQSPPTVTLTTQTFWEFFNKMRLVGYPGVAIDSPASNLSFSATATDPANQSVSWATVARRLIEVAMSGDASNLFPINLPAPASGSATIDYAAADLKNPGQCLSDIVGQDNPPEILFDANWSDQNQTYFHWDMYAVDGRLGQLGFPHIWDYQEACQSLKYSRDPSQMVFNVIEKGADNRSDASTGVLSWSESDIVVDKQSQGWPNIVVGDTSHSSETKNSILYSYANGLVRTNQNPVVTVVATVRVDGKSVNGEQTGSPSLDQVAIGDTAYIQVTDHPFLADGKYGGRILTIGNGQDLWTAALTMQILGVTQ